MSSRAYVLVALCLSAAPLGCKNTADAGGNALANAVTGSPDEAAAAEGSGSQALIHKINVYVACLNQMNPALRDSRKRYLEWAPVKTGPTLGDAGRGVSAVKRETTYGFECFKRDGGLDELDGKPPAMPDLDRAGASYKQALLHVMDTTQQAAEYYDHHDYKDDKLAKGKQLHAALGEAYSKFDGATRELEATLQKIQDKLDDARLAELEQGEGKRAMWHQRNVMRRADLLIRAVNADAAIDQATIAPLGEAFTRAFQDCKAWTDANKAEADKNVSWGSFVREADELLTAVKEMNRGFRDHHQVPESGNGSVENLIYEFNGLVNTSNGLWH